MEENKNTIIRFYTAFQNDDAEKMAKCYNEKVQFEDPVFGVLKRENVGMMWKMLLKQSKGNLKIEFSDVKANQFSGSAKWIAIYNFSKTNRKVVNTIYSEFEFKEGLILKQQDHFDVWKWAKQALGFKGFILGWTGFMQNQLQKQARLSLNNFISKDKNIIN